VLDRKKEKIYDMDVAVVSLINVNDARLTRHRSIKICIDTFGKGLARVTNNVQSIRIIRFYCFIRLSFRLSVHWSQDFSKLFMDDSYRTDRALSEYV
jgi:hypothetical protein